MAGPPSAQTFCAAVDSGGYEIETADGGATWTAPVLLTGTTGTPPLNAVSCPTASFCVAVDSGGKAYLGAPLAAPVNGGTAPTVANPPTSASRRCRAARRRRRLSGPAPSVTYRVAERRFRWRAVD